MKLRLLALVVASALSACAAPGSSIGRVALSGEVSGAPNNLSLEVVLPKKYGLGGLDLVMNEPEDFGHKDQLVKIMVREGRFAHEFPPLAYHVTFFLLPPLGAFPKQPPAPVYTLIFSDSPNEIYLVGMDRKKFRYEVYAQHSKEYLSPDAAKWLLEEGEYVSVESKEGKVWHLRIKAKPNKRLHSDVPPAAPQRAGRG